MMVQFGARAATSVALQERTGGEGERNKKDWLWCYQPRGIFVAKQPVS